VAALAARVADLLAARPTAEDSDVILPAASEAPADVDQLSDQEVDELLRKLLAGEGSRA